MQSDNTMVRISRPPLKEWLLNKDGDTKEEFGVIIADWKNYSADLCCHIHYLDILVDGTRQRYFRPIIPKSYRGIDDLGMWELVNSFGVRNKAGHCIRKMCD